jgi:hypothetical protein
MKKIIKLTESDLTRIVKRVIKENDVKTSLIDTIKNEGFKSASEMVGGAENLMKLLDIKSPMGFLHLFDNLEVVRSEKSQYWTLFRHKPNDNVMLYDRRDDDIYMSDDEIWLILTYYFNLSYTESHSLIMEWLNEVYNFEKVTPMSKSRVMRMGWMRHTI